MAIATSTALAIGGIATSAAGAGASFIQAAKQQGLQRKAEAAAEKAMAEARKKLDVNFYDQLSINKEPYELQREALLSQGAQAITAAQEGERNVAATAGRVAMAQNEAQGQIRTAMGREMQDLERLSATEESRLRDVNVQIDMEQAKGAQLAARDAQRQAAAANAAGLAAIQQGGQQALNLVPLYAKQSTAKLNQGAVFSNPNAYTNVPGQPQGLAVKQTTMGGVGQIPQTTAAKISIGNELQGAYNPYAANFTPTEFTNIVPQQNLGYNYQRTGSMSGPGWNAAGFDIGAMPYDPLNPYNQ